MPSYLLDTTSFPLYAVNALGKEHRFVVAGGGGPSKTGVPNKINYYILTRKGSKLTADPLSEQLTGTQAVMNLDVSPTDPIIAVGMDNLCKLFKPKDKNAGVDNFEGKQVMRELATQETASAGSDEDDEYQTCVKFSADGQLVVTGASDGHVKVMECPSLNVKHDIEAHDQEIDDLDVHPNSKKFVTVCRDCTAYVWRLDTGQKDLQLYFTADLPEENAFKFRNCRFSHNKNDNQVYMYTTHLPTRFPKSSPKPSNYLVKWDTAKWIPKISIEINKHSASALAVSHNGTYVAVGTADGSILIYTSWNLRLLHKVPEVHNIFVTSMTFMPERPYTHEEMKQDVVLLSVSVDNTCQLTTVPTRSEFSFGVVLSVFAVIMILLFILLTQYDVNFDVWK